jgi:imidazolonepropionase-like amidohydrolase
LFRSSRYLRLSGRQAVAILLSELAVKPVINLLVKEIPLNTLLRVMMHGAGILAVTCAATAGAQEFIAKAGPTGEVEGPPKILFTNVNVFDGNSNKLHEAMQVLVEGNLIKSVGGDIEAGNAQVIDGAGRTLMPGLIDAHVHLNLQLLDNPAGIAGISNMTWEELGALAKQSSDEYLASGFTTVRDLCGASTGLRKHVDAGTLTGPRMYMSGACISQTSGHGDWRPDSGVVRKNGNATSHVEDLGIVVLADGADAVLRATRNNLAGGADFTKMMAGGGVTSDRDPIHSVQGTPEELGAMVTATGQWGTFGAVHAYHDESVRNALEAGVMSIEHGNLMQDPNTFKLLKKKNAWLVPAMAGFSADLREHPFYGNPATPTYEKVRKVMDNAETFIALANKYEVNMGFGTDVVVSSLLASRGIRDFQMGQWVESFGAFRTLKAMTGDNARLMALTGKNNPYPGKLGVIEEGAYADIILVDGNPLEDMTVLGASFDMWATPRSEASIRTIPFVMKDGKVYSNRLQ